MMNDVNSKYTSLIYDNLTNKLAALVQAIGDNNQDATIRCAQEEAKKVLTQIQQQLTWEYAELKKNSEWKHFTIAFYGETNAGKSTIIETLRLLLCEQTKSERIARFRKIAAENNISQEAFDIIRKKILTEERHVEEAQTVLDAYNDTPLAKEVAVLKGVVKELKTAQEAEAQGWNILVKFYHFFVKTRLQKDLILAKDKLSSLEKDFLTEYKRLEKVLQGHKAETERLERDEAQMREKTKLLEDDADGKIIGTGVSDFTRTNTIYNFNLQDVEFSLIDVPGIEGNESVVKDSILEAVQKAHAVFYVTRKAAAPQTGGEREGTLEKIKRHLGAQTEVWTIFNQAVTNPIRLSIPLINEDEVQSLSNMHTLLQDELGKEHYRGEIVLSAYPAFLAVATCLVPGSKDMQSRLKFLGEFSSEKLLELTGMQKFLQMLPTQIIGNWQEKILYSNYNKAFETLLKAVGQLTELQEHNFIPLEKKLAKNTQDSQNQLVNAVNMLRSELNGISANMAQNFQNNVRSRIYSVIDDDISNSSFEDYLETFLQEEQNKLEDGFKNEAQDKLMEFQDIIQKVVQRAHEHADKLIEDMQYTPKFGDFNIRVNIDNGINVWGVIGAIGSGIALAFSTGGVSLVLGVISLLASVWSAVRSWFSSSYKKKEQRKNADRNIRNAVSQLEISLNDCVHDITVQVSGKVNEINCELDKLVLVVKNINKELRKSKDDLLALRDELEGDLHNG